MKSKDYWGTLILATLIGVGLIFGFWLGGRLFFNGLLVLSVIVLLFIIIENPRQIFNPILLFVYKLVTSQWRQKYLPPTIAVQGLGIRRRLTRYEAALLMQQPLDRLVLAILRDIESRGAVRVITNQPLKLEFSKPINGDLDGFEKRFLRACQHKEKKRTIALAGVIAHQVKAVTMKMQGFSFGDTINFYRNDVEKYLTAAAASKLPPLAEGLIGDPGLFTQAVTQQTNPLPKAWQLKETPRYLKRREYRTGSDGGGYDSGGGNCDCASCACACACACAGGGH